MRKVLFLDIDGVLVTEEIFENNLKAPDGNFIFDRDCMCLLEDIVSTVSAELVITSSWRANDLDYLREVFKLRGFSYPEKIIGETIRGYRCVQKGKHLPIPRGVEIKAWVDQHLRYVPKSGFVRRPGCDFQYVILDDAADILLEQADHFVKTDGRYGLLAEDAMDVLRIFGK